MKCVIFNFFLLFLLLLLLYFLYYVLLLYIRDNSKWVFNFILKYLMLI
jgi:hypothetical protein